MPAAATEPVVERLDPSRLDELEPLWEGLMSRHAEVWGLLPMREPHHSWTLRRGHYEGWLADEGSFVLVAGRDNVLTGYLMMDVGEGDETYETGEQSPGWRPWSSPRPSSGIDDVFVGYMDGNGDARRFYERRGFTPFVHHLYAKRPAARPAAKEDA